MEPVVCTREPIGLLIAVAVRLYREGLATTLSAQPDLHVDGTAATALEIQRAVCDRQPDVVLVDVSFDNILELIQELRGASTRSRVLAFAVQEDLTTILTYVSAGADGFVTANSSVAELVEAIRRAHAGEVLCSPQLVTQLLRQAARRPADDVRDQLLTGREQQVLLLLKEGRSNKEIARELTIAEATVKNHVHHVLEKLQLTRRGQAATARPPALKSHLAGRSSRRAG